MPGTSIESKLKCKEAANKLRHGSPKFRDILRSRCKTRIAEVRSKNYNCRRNLQSVTELKKVITDIFFEEAVGLDDDIELQDKFYKELIEAESEWLLSEYEREEAFNIDNIVNNLLEGVLCPICQKDMLIADNKTLLSCLCGVKLQSQNGLESLQLSLDSNIDNHSENCSAIPEFYSVPVIDEEIHALIMICSKCNFSSNIS